MNILKELLTCLHIKHTDYYVEKILNENPENDNLYGLQRMLKVYGLSSKGIHFGDKEQAELTFPCVFCMNNQFVVGLDCTERFISLNIDGKQQDVAIEKFNKTWTGNALLLDGCENAIEPDYINHKRINFYETLIRDGIFLVPFLLLLLAFAFSGRWMDSYLYPLLFISAIGAGVSFLLLQKQVQSNSKIGDKVCSLLKHKSCNTVTESKGAYILHSISWSEVGFAFFLSCLAMDICMPQWGSTMMIITMFAMVYGLWSVYYQAKVVKSWCILCLMVQLVVWLAGGYRILLFYNGIIQPTYSAVASLLSVFVFLSLNVLIVHFISLYFSSKKEIASIRRENNKIKLEREVFNLKLNKTEEYPDPKPYSNLIWGNADSGTLITIVMNPHCNPCAKLHEMLDELMDVYRDDVAIQFFLVSFNESLEDDSKSLIAVWLQNDHLTAKRIFKEWFSGGRLKGANYFSKEKIDIADAEVIEEWRRQREWLLNSKVKGTPTIIVNSRALPEDYTLEDVMKMEY